VVFPLANLVATGQIKLGDFIRIDRTQEGSMTFTKEAEGALVPVMLERYGQEAAASSASGKAARARNIRGEGFSPLLDKIG
jgi:hypothetical protein